MSTDAGKLRALTPREASIYACLTDVIVDPEPLLPAVRYSRAAYVFDAWLARAPGLNRAALRTLLYAIELAPYALGKRARLRRLPRASRAAVIERLAGGSPAGRGLVELARLFAVVGYYGDDTVSRQLGYDADAVVARGRRLRAEQGRP